MLNGNKNIDQLFREKLADYQKTPPAYLWTNIQGGLNAHRRVLRYKILKAVAMAAAIIFAFLAGWWMTNPNGKNPLPQNSFTEQREVKSNPVDASDNNIKSAENKPAESNQIVSNPRVATGQVNFSKSTKLSSLATFAANTSFINNIDQTKATKSGDLELFENENEFIDQIHQNFKSVKKLTDWITAAGKDSIADTEKKPKINISDSFKHIASDGSVSNSFNTPVRKNAGRWSLKAEFSPVVNSQSSNSGKDLAFADANSTPNYTPQKTTTENTFSGGMVAGYKVGKRLIVKSGFIFNNIRQTTQNVDLKGVNPSYSVPGNSILASTPAGQVRMNKTGNSRSETVLNSNYSLASTDKYSGISQLNQDINFIEIPLQATYKLVDNKFNIGLNGGISTNILIGNKAVLSDNGGRIGTGETANMRSIVYSGAVGIEVGYEITNRITLTVEPRIKHFINSLSTSKSVTYKPYQMGIVTGLTYSFN